VKCVGWNFRNPAPGREQCKTDAPPLRCGATVGRPLVGVGAGGEVGVEKREAELARALECPVEPNQPSHPGHSSDLRFGG
jgi:hypothetical protein